MKKIATAILFSVLTVMCITGCSAREPEEQDYVQQGSANAIQYVQEKYEEQAEVVKVRVTQDFVTDTSGLPELYDYTIPIFVTVKTKDDEFTVITEGYFETSEGVDSKESEQIRKGLIEYIASVFSITEDKIDVKSKWIDNEFFLDKRTYFDGVGNVQTSLDYVSLGYENKTDVPYDYGRAFEIISYRSFVENVTFFLYQYDNEENKSKLQALTKKDIRDPYRHHEMLTEWYAITRNVGENTQTTFLVHTNDPMECGEMTIMRDYVRESFINAYEVRGIPRIETGSKYMNETFQIVSPIYRLSFDADGEYSRARITIMIPKDAESLKGLDGELALYTFKKANHFGEYTCEYESQLHLNDDYYMASYDIPSGGGDPIFYTVSYKNQPTDIGY